MDARTSSHLLLSVVLPLPGTAMFGSTHLYCFVVLAFGLAVSAVRSERTTLASSTMNITAITGKQGVSVLECWALAAKFVTSTQAGTVGAANLALGDLANATFTVLPPRFNGGEHNAPSVQLRPLPPFTFSMCNPWLNAHFPQIRVFPVRNRGSDTSQLDGFRHDPRREGRSDYRRRHGCRQRWGTHHDLPHFGRDHSSTDPHAQRSRTGAHRVT